VSEAETRFKEAKDQKIEDDFTWEWAAKKLQPRKN
jgi:hypothetical protein